MHPTIAQCGPLTISSYGVALAIAFLVAIWAATRATTRSLAGLVPVPASRLADLACWALVGGLLGGRALYVVLNWELYWVSPLEMFELWHGGLIWYGGFLGGVAAAWWFLHRQRWPFLQAMDQVSPFFLALAHAIGRIGCWLNGCCLGTTRMPIQLLEAGGLAFLYIGLRALQRPALLRRPGTVFGAYLIGYGVLRWFVEYVRLGQPSVWAGLTPHQIISFLLLIAGGYLLVRQKHQAPNSKSQTNSKRHIPNVWCLGFGAHLVLGIWCSFGAWDLVLGYCAIAW